MKYVNKRKIIKATKLMLEALQEDLDRPGLKETPLRVAKAWKEMMSGYAIDNAEILAKTFDDITHENSTITMVDIPIYSFCEHHLLPFFGTAEITYTPKKGGKIVGLSKLNRLVQNVSRKLQTQERITFEIANAIKTHLEAESVTVILKCRHMCIEMRGVSHQNSLTITKETL